MQEKQLYEYAVIRVVPRMEREEFINVGVILYSRGARFLKCLYSLNKEKLAALCSETDAAEVEGYLKSFDRICKGEKNGGPIAQLDPASRFRWLTATRSTVLQTSKIHPGFCSNADECLNKLFHQLVL